MLLVTVSPSLANPDSDRLNQAGMLGSWAVDCNAPPSKTNPYQLFAPSSSGSPTRTLQMDTPSLDGTLTIKDVRVIASDRVGLSWTDRSGDTLRMIVLKTGNRLKGFELVSERSGKTSGQRWPLRQLRQRDALVHQVRREIAVQPNAAHIAHDLEKWHRFFGREHARSNRWAIAQWPAPESRNCDHRVPFVRAPVLQ